MPKVPATGSVPTVHAAGVAPPVPKSQLDPCRHRRNKKKKTKYIIYVTPEDLGSGPTGKYYVGRSRGPASKTVQQIKDARKAKHHRTDIGEPEVVCETDTYSAIRGAEQKHYEDKVAKNQAITSPRKKGQGKQIAPIAADNKKKADYLACAKASAQPSPPGCSICAA